MCSRYAGETSSYDVPTVLTKRLADLRRKSQQVLRSTEVPHHEQTASAQVFAKLPCRPDRRRSVQRRKGMAGQSYRKLARLDCGAHAAEQHADAAATAATDAGAVMI
jgi:hypothetical protein